VGDGIGDCGRGGVGTRGGDGVPGDPGAKETAMTDLCAWLGMSGLNTALLLETVLLLFLGGGFVFKFVTTACQTRDLVLIVTFSPIFRAPLAFSSLLMFESLSKNSFPSYRTDPLPKYFIEIFSIVTRTLSMSWTCEMM
jgi:hypothetical protein